MEALFRLLPGPQPILVRYGATTMLVLIAFAIRLGLEESTGRYGFLIFILPVVASALLFDRGTGFFATALSAALVASVLPWQAHAEVHIAAIITFLTVGDVLYLSPTACAAPSRVRTTRSAQRTCCFWK
jgi:hypothetical protein